MNRTIVASSNIVSIGHDRQTKILEIEFKGGNIYQYRGVSDDVFKAFTNASSHGKYFHAFIRDKYSSTKIN